jgi:hypothetical protein
MEEWNVEKQEETTRKKKNPRQSRKHENWKTRKRKGVVE